MTGPSVRNILKKIYKLTKLSGFDLRELLSSLRFAPQYLIDLVKYVRQSPPENFKVSLSNISPVLHDFKAKAGEASGHYFHQDLWAATKIFKRQPAKHIDIGSRVDGFIAHLLVFMEVEVVDIRPLHSEVKGLKFLQDDATHLSSFESNSVVSLSCLHAAEHFGLGRYGDPIDAVGCFKFMEALERVLAKDGRLYFSVPVGRERVEFNEYRVFNVKTILEKFAKLKLVSFSFVDDVGNLVQDLSPAEVPECNYSCGLFEFSK